MLVNRGSITEHMFCAVDNFEIFGPSGVLYKQLLSAFQSVRVQSWYVIQDLFLQSQEVSLVGRGEERPSCLCCPLATQINKVGWEWRWVRDSMMHARGCYPAHYVYPGGHQRWVNSRVEDLETHCVITWENIDTPGPVHSTLAAVPVHKLSHSWDKTHSELDTFI